MDEDERSARLLGVIAGHLGLPVEAFTQYKDSQSKVAAIESMSQGLETSMQAFHLLRLYWSLPDQTSRDAAVQVVENLAKR